MTTQVVQIAIFFFYIEKEILVRKGEGREAQKKEDKKSSYKEKRTKQKKRKLTILRI